MPGSKHPGRRDESQEAGEEGDRSDMPDQPGGGAHRRGSDPDPGEVHHEDPASARTETGDRA